MAVTENSYTGNGSQTNYPFTFPYLKSTDVEVQVDATVTTAWTFANATTVQFNSAPANGAKIKILRQTNVDNLTATFYAGSAIKSEDLNDNYTQNLYKTQEVGNRFFQTTGGTMSGDLTMGEDANIVFEGATDNAHETTLTVADPTADRTVTLPDETGTLITTGASGVITGTMLAANSVDSSELVDGSVDTSHIGDSQVTNAKLATDSVGTNKIQTGNVTTAKIADNNITTAKIADSNVTTAKIADSNITTAKIADSNVTTAKIAADAITGAKIADDAVDSEHLAAGSVDLEHMSANSVDSDQYVDGSVDSVHLASDVIDGTKLADNAVDSEHITTGAVDLTHMSANSVDSDQYVDGSIDRVHLEADIIDGTKLADNAVGTEHIADAELTTLAGMQSGTASILAGGTALTATLSELNTVCDGKGVHTTISDSDAHYPTSGAVIDYVTAQIAPLGGLEVIATEVAFPATANQPQSGVAVSIADAGGIVFNGSGVSTTGRTTDGTPATVTINGAPSSLYGETLAAGVGLMVTSTGSNNTYTYHKILAAETDVKQLSDDINDFNARYRVNAGEPSSNNDEGDLVFDTNANKMKVYDGSSWGEVTSTGDFKFLVAVDAGTTTAATFDGSDTSFDLKEATNSGSAASVTNINQLIVSLNGVIQKPNAGSWSGSGEGFYLTDADTIRFATAPPSGSSCFIIQCGSAVSIPTPGDNTVATDKIQNGAVTEDKLALDSVTVNKIADQAVQESKIYIANAGTNGYFLQYQSNVNGQMQWAAVPSGTPTTTRGDIIYRGASADERLAKGTAGQYLKIGANDPEWADVVAATADGVLWENNLTISNNYTIAATKGAHSVGPITNNATVTVNGRWVIS